MKTVHGADFYANKKHKGDSCHGNEDGNGYHSHHRGSSVNNGDAGVNYLFCNVLKNFCVMYQLNQVI